MALNLVSMFVPVLGEVMMAVMASQLLYETFEGVMEWSEGDREVIVRRHYFKQKFISNNPSCATVASPPSLQWSFFGFSPTP